MAAAAADVVVMIAITKTKESQTQIYYCSFLSLRIMKPWLTLFAISVQVSSLWPLFWSSYFPQSSHNTIMKHTNTKRCLSTPRKLCCWLTNNNTRQQRRAMTKTARSQTPAEERHLRAEGGNKFLKKIGNGKGKWKSVLFINWTSIDVKKGWIQVTQTYILLGESIFFPLLLWSLHIVLFTAATNYPFLWWKHQRIPPNEQLLLP